jgi:hypothetical protein
MVLVFLKTLMLKIYIESQVTHLRQDTVKPIMVRQAHHERLNLKLSRFKCAVESHARLSSSRFQGPKPLPTAIPMI